jgi:uncharacterized protein (UPF0248 family)
VRHAGLWLTDAGGGRVQVVFVVEGQKVPAHRFILKVRSEHFRAMFSKYARSPLFSSSSST